MVNVDWTTYPPLPAASKLPEWRDTPEREAYFRELDDCLRFPKIGCFCYAAGLSLIAIGWTMLAWNAYSFIGNILVSFGAMLLLLFWLGMLVLCIFRRIYLAVKYRVFPIKLRRPDISKEVAAIMAARSDFNETEFRKYWPTERHANMALQIIGWGRENWELPDKMLYPNDPLMLLYEYKLTGDVEDYEDNFNGLSGLEQIFWDYDNTFAGLVEPCAGCSNDHKKENA